jgi:signal transduction histidine kinase
MRLPAWMRLPSRLPGLFMLATLVPVIALVWLGWRLLEQDHALENQRTLERLEDAADLIAAAIDRRISGIQDQLADLETFFPSSNPPDGALIVRLDPRNLDAYPPGRLLFSPQVASMPKTVDDIFENGEISEFVNHDYVAAAANFRSMARSDDPAIRAGALGRLARNLRKAGRHKEALSVYDELAALGSIPFGEDPSELVGRHARCALLHQLEIQDDLLKCSLELYNDLQDGRWPLTRTSYQYYTAEVEKWLGKRAERPGDLEEKIALSSAVDSFWKSRSEYLNDTTPARGCRSFRVDDRSYLLILNRSTDDITVLFAGRNYLLSEWKDIWEERRLGLSLIDGEGYTVTAQPPADGKPQVVRPASDTGLPWTLRVIGAGTDAAQSAARRRILITVLAVMALAVLVCGYFTARAAMREMDVARLQSDFVSAVSHEFRTPLTSMRHLTELLEGGKVSSEDRKQKFYNVLAHETRRLHRLVESLLNFGRMEAGKFQYQSEKLDAEQLVREVIAEFQSEGNGESSNIELAIAEGQDLVIRGDRESIALALWNLLDNAVKYSSSGSTVRVELEREGSCAAIRVRDHGTGISESEQREIFKKFVRGSASKDSSANGTGIGLAIVQHILHAHRGTVRVESRSGEGSVFTMLLPAEIPASGDPKAVEKKP